VFESANRHLSPTPAVGPVGGYVNTRRWGGDLRPVLVIVPPVLWGVGRD